jgi:hypothetical protein
VCGTAAHREDDGASCMHEEGDNPRWPDLGRSAIGSWVESLELWLVSVETKKKNKLGRMMERVKNKDNARWATETIFQI